jgi:hypothetical protein
MRHVRDATLRASVEDTVERLVVMLVPHEEVERATKPPA